MESRLSSQPLESMISVLAYREQKFWLTNHRLGIHLSPTNGNHGHFLLQAITSQQIELECCSNPVKMEESLVVCNGKNHFRFGCRSFFVVYRWQYVYAHFIYIRMLSSDSGRNAKSHFLTEFLLETGCNTSF